jgi:hypothetical protein
MTITLNHTIVPSHAKERSANFFARVFGLEYAGVSGPFAAVHVDDSLTLDWGDRDTFESHHYAFLVNEQEFDGIFDRLKAEGVIYGSQPNAPQNGEINTRLGAAWTVLRRSRRPPPGDHDPRVTRRQNIRCKRSDACRREPAHREDHLTSDV